MKAPFGTASNIMYLAYLIGEPVLLTSDEYKPTSQWDDRSNIGRATWRPRPIFPILRLQLHSSPRLAVNSIILRSTP